MITLSGIGTERSYDDGYADGRAEALTGMPLALPGAKIYKATSVGVISRHITRVERSEGGDWQYWTGEYYMYPQCTYRQSWFLSFDEAFKRFGRKAATRDGRYRSTHGNRSSPVYTWADLEMESNGKKNQ